MFQKKSCRENQNTHFMFINPPPDNRTVYDVLWWYVPADSIIRRMRFACWIIKATHTHTHREYLILLFQDSNGFANAPLCYVYTYISCLVFIEENFEHVIRKKLIAVLYVSFKHCSARYSVVDVRLHFHCCVPSKSAVPYVTTSRWVL